MIAGDIRFALRQIRRTPLFSSVIIAVLAMGIGINAGLLTVLDLYAWRPAPGIAPDARLARLVPTAASATGQSHAIGLSYADVRALRGERGVFTDVAAWRGTWLAADFGGGAERVVGIHTTANYFRLLRVPMAAGTGFPGDADGTADPIVVIGHSLWMTHFAGSPDAIGKTIRIMNRPFTVVGVAPPRFAGVDVSSMGRPTIWMPLGARAILEPAMREVLTRRDAMSFEGFARLAPRVDADDVRRLTGSLAARLAAEEPTAHRSLAISAERMTGMRSDRSDTGETITAFMIVAGLIMVITCTNVSALLIGRAVSRRREIGVRLALGASRIRIVRQMLTESLVLALMGGALAMLLYVLATKTAYETIPEVIYGLQANAATFVFAAIFAIATTIAAGVAPALHASRARVGEVIKNSGSHDIRRARLQATFVVVQLAASLPVLVVSSLVLVNLRGAATNASDTAPVSVLAWDSELWPPFAADTGTPAARDSATRAGRATYELIRRRLEEIPGVQSAAFSIAAGGRLFESPGSGVVPLEIEQLHVSPAYFATLGIPIVRGRAIGAEDDRAGFSGVVVNEETAQRLWPGENPVGRRLVRRARGRATERDVADADRGTMTAIVIGVAGSLSYQGNRSTPMLFAPMANASNFPGASMAVRTSVGNARAVVPQVRAAMREVNPLATVGDVATLAERYAARAREETLSNAAAFGVGIAALLLASLGLYGTIAFGVAQRTREIGIRLAVGATARDVVRHFLREGLKVTAIALAIGLPLTVAGIRLVQAQQVDFSLRNVAGVLLVVPVLVAIAVLASWLPARRAGRVDPLVALRTD